MKVISRDSPRTGYVTVIKLIFIYLKADEYLRPPLKEDTRSGNMIQRGNSLDEKLPPVFLLILPKLLSLPLGYLRLVK